MHEIAEKAEKREKKKRKKPRGEAWRREENKCNKNSGDICNEPQKLNTKLLGFIICIRNIQLKRSY